jgi:hypothetical protein
VLQACWLYPACDDMLTEASWAGLISAWQDTEGAVLHVMQYHQGRPALAGHGGSSSCSGWPRCVRHVVVVLAGLHMQSEAYLRACGT